MKQYRNNEMSKLYMSFEIEKGYEKEVLRAVWDYAIKVCTNGYDFFRKNLIHCKSASSCTIHWDYDDAQVGDKYCKFCCGSVKNGISVNGFVNSRPVDEDSDVEVYFVRLALGPNISHANSDWFNGHSGMLQNNRQAQDFDKVWLRVANQIDNLYLKKTA